jgi:hypothetical protein
MENDETPEMRLARLERVVVLQQQMLARLATAAHAHQATIEALADLAGVDFRQQLAPLRRQPGGPLN